MNRYKPVGWRFESQRHSLAAKGIKTRYSFQISEWSPEKTKKMAEGFAKGIKMPKQISGESDEVYLSKLEKHKKLLEKTEKDLRDVDTDVKKIDIDTMRIQKAMTVAAIGATSAAVAQGSEIVQEAGQVAQQKVVAETTTEVPTYLQDYVSGEVDMLPKDANLSHNEIKQIADLAKGSKTDPFRFWVPRTGVSVNETAGRAAIDGVYAVEAEMKQIATLDGSKGVNMYGGAWTRWIKNPNVQDSVFRSMHGKLEAAGQKVLDAGYSPIITLR